MSLFIEHCAPRAIYVTIINSNAHRSQDHHDDNYHHQLY